MPFTPPIPDPELADLFIAYKKDVFLNLNCHAIGTVQSFDSADQTVTLTINYTRSSFQRDEVTGLYEQSETSYPILMKCPVFILTGGGATITMPIAQGDQALVAFNDRDIDNWFSGASAGPVNTQRLHSISDAIAFIGLYPLGKSISSYDTTRALMKNGSTMVGVSSSKVKIRNAGTSLGTALSDLTNALETFLTGLTTVTLAAQAATALTAVTAAATELSGLLE